MQIILVYNKIESYLKEITEPLEKQGFTFIEFNNADEVNQLGNHKGKVAVVFSDPKTAYPFLKEGRFGKLDIFNILYLQKTPVITPEIQSKLTSVHLNIYSRVNLKVLIMDIINFYSGKNSFKTDEIDFNIHKQIEKEAQMEALGREDKSNSED